MTTANYSAHDAATTEILPIYFIANEWRINWMERLTQALQDASEAAAIGATLSNVQTVFQAIRCAINDAIDRLDDAAKQPDCYDVIKRMSAGLEVSMLQHVNMLNVMILNSRLLGAIYVRWVLIRAQCKQTLTLAKKLARWSQQVWALLKWDQHQRVL